MDKCFNSWNSLQKKLDEGEGVFSEELVEHKVPKLSKEILENADNYLKYKDKEGWIVYIWCLFL